ncbi:hypothetical protein C3747_114g93 [Trypanosoma cruzi]|uniref:Uncharacterized protein n=2 Tax=Trypanosoma cruzi TaxID=5693 RepID=Q4D4E3_TRYCC|nr:hypothetical protein, conserved [Trypanosoma cruzi]EAN87387.1 hypothetical protein, conserved [Trypanosoma cruzi]PWV06518.1 hypothetical protein C3747_114g93 [Trypanosoma cruzi]RNC43246.1 hypothetical protein TcCL_NonESM07093 [Trypanosoma cruzi]|eukprot:XP_809238.1 hypothetical protein [Trypanosoma cruzi strain CL Brener]
MTSASVCPLCARSFNMLLWKHACDCCRKTVCDDCAPKVNGRRECRACAAKAKEQQSRQRNPSNPASAEEERAARMRAAEERMRAEQQRGRPQSRGVQRPGPPVTAPPKEFSLQQDRDYGTPSPSPHAGAPTRANAEENPVLAAALRRRQQEQLGMKANWENSSEKTRLLTAILEVLHQRGEEEPFGLRSMDEAKLQAYLRYVKNRDKKSGSV